LSHKNICHAANYRRLHSQQFDQGKTITQKDSASQPARQAEQPVAGRVILYAAHKEVAAMHVRVFQHADFEAPGAILGWAADRGAAVDVLDWSSGNGAAPDPRGSDLLVIMGGPMNVDETDRLPWLLDERAAIRAHLDAGVPTIGICLGAQLLARVLDAAVRPNAQREIGWFPVRLHAEAMHHTLLAGWPAEFTTLHWHGDTFDIPAGAQPIGSSEACANQGFIVGDRVVGLQFHPEATPSLVGGFIERAGLPGGERWVQSATELRDGLQHAPSMHAHLFALLDRLAATERP
jgi:GMP synthase-like glutamine amidotransferase